MSLKISTSKKLFHSAYLYKLQVRTPISSVFYKKKNNKHTFEYLDKLRNLLSDKGLVQINRWKSANVDDINNAESILKKLVETDSDYRVRCESYSFSIYTNDLNLLQNIGNDLTYTARARIWKPDDKAIDFLLNNKEASVSSKPVEYPYKIYLKSDMNGTNYDALVKWLTNNTEKAKVGKWCLINLQQRHWITGNYFYIKDLKTLTIIEMIAGKIISKVETITHIDDVDKT